MHPFGVAYNKNRAERDHSAPDGFVNRYYEDWRGQLHVLE
jgi:hypothetical protein